jgi:hypothetical protein
MGSLPEGLTMPYFKRTGVIINIKGPCTSMAKPRKEELNIGYSVYDMLP